MTSETGEKLFIVVVTAIFIIGQSIWLLFQFKREEKFSRKFNLKPKQNIGFLIQLKNASINLFEISAALFGLLYALFYFIFGITVVFGIPVLILLAIIKLIKWAWYF